METKVFVKSLSWSFNGFVKIDYIPLLVLSTVVTVYLNSLSFLILGSCDIKYLTVLPVDELVILVLEYLEPSRVSAPDLHVVGSSRTLDVP
jgi:hypothetical protein